MFFEIPPTWLPEVSDGSLTGYNRRRIPSLFLRLTSDLYIHISFLATFPESRSSDMELLRLIAFLVLISGILAAVSNINLNPTGEYAKLSPKGGLYVSVILLIYVLFGEMGFIPFRFKGRKKRSSLAQVMSPLLLGDKDVVLRLIRAIDNRDCLLRYLCELEALRDEAQKTNVPLDPAIEADLFMLKIAKKKMHPALLMREDPGSPGLAFEVAVFTGSQGLGACSTSYIQCPYNLTSMRMFLGDEMGSELNILNLNGN